MEKEFYSIVEKNIRLDAARIPIMSKGVLASLLSKVNHSDKISSLETMGCYEVATIVAEIINNNKDAEHGVGFQCSKIFAFGKIPMYIETEIGSLNWSNHVAVLVKTVQKKADWKGLFVVSKVIDPFISKKAMYIDEWIGRIAKIRNYAVKPNIQIDETVLSYLIFPSFFLKPNMLNYYEIYKGYKLTETAEAIDFKNPLPLI